MNNINLLAFLLNNKEEQFTINQLAKALNINYRIAHTQIKNLEQEGLIKTKRVGQALLCSLTNNYNKNIYLAEDKRRSKLLKDSTIKQIHLRYTKAKQPYILLLFGSRAKQEHTKHSDIDLLAITQQPEEIEEITKLIPKNIHLTTTTYEEFLKMKQSKQLTVVSEAINNNIILVGIEEYYRLLNQ